MLKLGLELVVCSKIAVTYGKVLCTITKGGLRMSLIPSFSINTVVENADIIIEFKCGNMGGMRRSKQTNT